MSRPRFLLDTAAVIWVADGSLPVTPREAYQNPLADIYVSVVSLWEIGIKHALGKLPLPKPYVEFLRDWEQIERVTLLPLTPAPLRRLPSLPPVHRDPFDRLLVCQALDLGASLLSPDPALGAYGVGRVW